MNRIQILQEAHRRLALKQRGGDTAVLLDRVVEKMKSGLKNRELIPGPQGEKGERGETGRKGERGSRGERGERGRTGKQGPPGKNGSDGRDGVDGLNGSNGKDGSPDQPSQIREKLESLSGNDRLDAKAIKNLPVQEVRPVTIFGGGGKLEVVGGGQDIRRIAFTGATVTRQGDGSVEIAAGGGVSDHGALTGLGDDDHTQYALLAGRSGGQTLIGGTAASNGLTLTSTSNSTKGVVTVGTQFTVNESTLRGGFGTLQTAHFSVTGKANEVQVFVKGHSTQTTNILTVQNSSSTNLLTLSNTASLTVTGGTSAALVVSRTTTSGSSQLGLIRATGSFSDSVSGISNATGMNISVTASNLADGGLQGLSMQVNGTVDANLDGSSSSIYGLSFEVFENSSNGTAAVSEMGAVSGFARHSSLGVLPSVYMFNGDFQTASGAGVTDSVEMFRANGTSVVSNVTNWYSFRAYNPGVSGGAVITNFYGLKIEDNTAATNVFPIYSDTASGRSILHGRLSVGGTSTPTAILHLAAGTATANTAPLKFTTGTNLTTPEAGVMEFSSSVLSFTEGSVRKPVDYGRALFDHFADAGNVGTGEDDLYSDTIPAGRLANNGDKLSASYGGTFVSSATATRQVRAYFGGTLIFDTGALSLSSSSSWTLYIDVIRVSSSVVRCMASLSTQGAALSAYTAYTEVTGLTLTNTQIMKITGEAAGVGAATNDIVAKLSSIHYVPVV